MSLAGFFSSHLRMRLASATRVRRPHESSSTITTGWLAIIANQPIVIVLLDSWGRLTRVADANRIRKWLEKNPSKLVGTQFRPG